MKSNRQQKGVLPLPIIFLVLLTILGSCGVQRNLKKWTSATLADSAFNGAHTGICIYDADKGAYLYNYQADKYFVPASNTKLPTCYAAMKYLGDSLAGIRYRTPRPGVTQLLPTGDPTLLHTDFKKHPAADFLLRQKTVVLNEADYNRIWKDERFGYGWAWDDYADNYMVERNALPVYGNMLRYELTADSMVITPAEIKNIRVTPPVLGNKILIDSFAGYRNFSLRRMEQSQLTKVEPGGRFTRQFVPVFNASPQYAVSVISRLMAERHFLDDKYADSLKAAAARARQQDYIPEKITPVAGRNPATYFNEYPVIPSAPALSPVYTIRSQPTDSVLKPMMHRSDNFYAEQMLLMVSNEKLGYMNAGDIIDTLLNTGLAGMPQRPKWVDGSGLSRYNLFTPQDFVWILNKMKTEFGMERLKEILPTGGEGTLRSYYLKDSGFIFAKTGTLSNHVALSGFLITQKGKLLIFSVLVNGYMNGVTGVRRAVEALLRRVREKF